MPHAMILVPHDTDADWLDRDVDEELVRARAEFITGTYRAVAFASPTHPARLPDAHVSLCRAADCLMYLLLPPMPVVSHIRPAREDHIVIALLTLPPGGRRPFVQHVGGLYEPAEGVQQACNLVVGPPGVDAVLELVGADFEAVMNRLIDVTDVAGVAGVDVHYTTTALTRGFGGSADR
ncbi:MAG: hypothetical protein M3N21_00645 [Actinomycetota bacterium]|nr:hypothetical protein [Actinomycetota bacterium]